MTVEYTDPPAGDQITTSSSLFSHRDAGPAPLPQTVPPGGNLRCDTCGTEGQLRPEGFWQCPTCAKRLDPAPAASNEQPAIPVDQPQPNKAQDLQLIPAAEQPDAIQAENDHLALHPTVEEHVEGVGTVVRDNLSSLTAFNPEPTPEFKPADEPPTNDNTLGQTVNDGWTEPDPTTHAGGGREGDPTLGDAGEPSRPLSEDFRQEQPIDHEQAVAEQQRINAQNFVHSDVPPITQADLDAYNAAIAKATPGTGVNQGADPAQ